MEREKAKKRLTTDPQTSALHCGQHIDYVYVFNTILVVNARVTDFNVPTQVDCYYNSFKLVGNQV